jgi:hypothetical protein
MRRRYTLGLPILAGLTAIAVIAPAATAQQVELRLKGSPGDTGSYAIDATRSFQLPDEFGGEQTLHATMTVHSRVAEVKADTIYYTLTVEEPSVDFIGANGGQTPDLSMFENQEFTVVLTTQGEAVDFVSPDGLGQAGAAVAASLSQFGSLPLPAAAVGVGDSWSDTTWTDGAMGLPASGQMVTISTITVTGISEKGGATIADLSVEAEFVFEPTADTEGEPEVDMTGAVVSNVRFDATNGVILGSSSASDFAADISGVGVLGSISIYGTSETTVTRQ